MFTSLAPEYGRGGCYVCSQDSEVTEGSLLICSPDSLSTTWLCARISPGWQEKVQQRSAGGAFSGCCVLKDEEHPIR